MSDMLPAKINPPRKWAVGPTGEISLWEPPKRSVTLTTGQQHAAMRIALAHTLRVLTEHGFRTNCIDQSSCAISLTGPGGMNFDISIREPGKIAYVTSAPMDTGQRRKVAEDRYGNPIYEVGSGVRLGSDEMRSAYVVQVIASRVSTLNPLYIDLPKNEPDPVKYVLKNIFMLLANIMKDQGLLKQADMDTSTMLKGELPAFLRQEMLDALTMLEDIPGSASSL
jgi:hypothetical protein